MQYEFITDLTENEYNELIKDSNYVHYKSDILWNKLHNMFTIIYVGLKQKKKFIGCAKIEISNNTLLVSHLYILKKDEINISLFINEIKLLAHKLNILEIIINDINFKDLMISKKKSIKKYSLIKLQDNNKFYRKDYFKKLFNQDTSTLLSVKTKLNKTDISNLKKTIANWSIKLDFCLEELIRAYKTKCIVAIEYLDLVYYKNQYSDISSDTIDELIDEYGEEMIVGFSILLFPNNKNTAYCISLNIIDAFYNLNIKDNLILETISTTLKKKYSNLIFIDNIKNAKDIYEFNYKIIINKFKYFISKLKRR